MTVRENSVTVGGSQEFHCVCMPEFLAALAGARRTCGASLASSVCDCHEMHRACTHRFQRVTKWVYVLGNAGLNQGACGPLPPPLSCGRPSRASLPGSSLEPGMPAGRVVKNGKSMEIVQRMWVEPGVVAPSKAGSPLLTKVSTRFRVRVFG